MNLGTNYLDAKAESDSIVINKVVTGQSVESPKTENADIAGHTNPAEVNTEISDNSVNKTPTEPKKVKTTPSESQENQKPIGRAVKAELTAYCNDPRCTGGNSKSKTAMQTNTRVGVIAAPSSIPLGSKIYIPGLKKYKTDGMFDVEDRGGAIKIKKDGTYVIDVWVPTYEDAVKFGRKTTTIYLIE